MKTRNYAVIGHPIGHTMSPFIHKNLFKMNNIDATYKIFDVATEDLYEVFHSTLCLLDGFNITIPHKQAIIPFIDELDKKAKMYGSVNTFFNDDGIYKGYTTDPDGFLKALSSVDISLGGDVTILGCGGVARTMAYEAVIANSNLTFAIRQEDMAIANNLKKEITKTFKDANISICTMDSFNGTSDLLVNATPVGMYPKTEICPVSDSVIFDSKAVFDAVYNPLETVLIQKAKANGAKAIGGMSMLVWQAVVAQQKWNDVDFDTDEINKLCVKCLEELKNK